MSETITNKKIGFLRTLFNLLKWKNQNIQYFGFYSDTSFLLGHVKKYVKKKINPKEEIFLNEGFSILEQLPIVIYYSNLCKSQIIENLFAKFIKYNIDYLTLENLFSTAIKKLPINRLDLPFINKGITPEMISDFKNTEKKGKYEDAIHISYAMSHNLPIITSEKREKLDCWKKHYPLTISTSKFWKYIRYINKIQEENNIRLNRLQLEKALSKFI